METFGQYLRSQRDKKGIRLEEIASITKIHLHSLQHLEASRWKELPPEPFIRGFIIAYSKYVGIDPKEAIDRYLLEMGLNTKVSEIVLPEDSGPSIKTRVEQSPLKESPTQIMERRQTLPSRQFVMAGAALLFLLVLSGMIYIGKHFAQREEVAANAVTTEENKPVVSSEKPVEPTTTVAVAEKTEPSSLEVPREPAATTVPQNSTAITAPVTPPVEPSKPVDPEVKHEVTLEGKERTWLKVVIDDKPPTQTFLKAGEKLTYSAKDKIKIVLGIATSTTVTHNGDVVTGKQYQGTIRYYIFPAHARFPQDPPKRATTSKDSDSSDKPTENTGGDSAAPIPTENSANQEN